MDGADDLGFGGSYLVLGGLNVLMMDNSYHVTVTTMQNKQNVIQNSMVGLIPEGSCLYAHLEPRIVGSP